jgi:ABC-type sugar transport system permease subunit
MKIIDRVFAGILVLAGLLHWVGSIHMYRNEPMTMLWSLCATLLTLLLAAINLLRVERPGDRPLAWISFAGSLSWAVAAFAAGVLIHNIFDPRPMMHWVTALVLAGFSLRAALGQGNAQA